MKGKTELPTQVPEPGMVSPGTRVGYVCVCVIGSLHASVGTSQPCRGAFGTILLAVYLKVSNKGPRVLKFLH